MNETALVQVCKSEAYRIGLRVISPESMEFRTRIASESKPSLQSRRIWDCLGDGFLVLCRFKDVRELQWRLKTSFMKMGTTGQN